jgi:hypothetical protein
MSEREPETEYARVPEVVEGEDEGLRQPAPPLDPYTPEPGSRPGERRAFRAMWLAILIVLAVAALVVWGAVR